MDILSCEGCGANLEIENGYGVCKYCGKKILIPRELIPSKSTEIALNKDVQLLLNKCKNDPKNAKRYANLILDIDPTNREARKFL